MTLKQALSDFPDDLKFLDESERLTQKHKQYLKNLKKFDRSSEITTSHNDALMQIIENQKAMQNQINALENKIDYHEKNSKSRTDNIIKTLFDMSNSVIAIGFKFIYDHFSK